MTKQLIDDLGPWLLADDATWTAPLTSLVTQRSYAKAAFDDVASGRIEDAMSGLALVEGQRIRLGNTFEAAAPFPSLRDVVRRCRWRLAIDLRQPSWLGGGRRSAFSCFASDAPPCVRC